MAEPTAAPTKSDGTPLDLTEIIRQFQYTSSAADAELRRVDQLEDGVRVSNEKQADAIIREGQLAGDLQRAVDNLLIERARKNKDSAAFFGTDQDVSNAFIREMAGKVLAQNTEIQASGENIKQKQSVKAGDDPLAWMINQFTLPSEISAHNTLVAIRDENVGIMTKLQNLTQEQIKINNQVDAGTTTAISNLSAQRNLAVAVARAEAAKQDAAKFGLQAGSIRLATNQNMFDNQVKVHNAEVALQQLQLSRMSHETNLEMKELQKKNLQLLIDKRDEDAQARAELQGNLDQATSVLGMRRLTVNDYDRAPANIKAALFEVMSDPNIKEGRLGYDAVDALKNADRLNAPLTPALQDVKKKLITWSTEVQAKDQTWATKKEDQKHTITQKYIEDQIKRESNNIPDQGGVYSAPPITAVGKIPAVAGTILWKSSFQSQEINRTRPLSAQEVYDAALSLVATGKMDIERASREISTIYTAIAVDNTQQRQYNRFGLPMQNNYRTSLNTSSMMGSQNKIVDMTSESEIRNNLMRAMAARREMPAGTMSALPRDLSVP